MDQSMSLPYEHLIPASQRAPFLEDLYALSSRLGIRAAWLMIVFYKESSVNPAAVNPKSGASGLIQFIPSTAKGLGTSVESIRKMSALDQLPWVEQYYQPFKGRMHSLWDVYLATFYPKAIGQPGEHVIARKGEKVYDWNKALDVNKNGLLSINDIKAWLMRYLPDSFDPCDCEN